MAWHGMAQDGSFASVDKTTTRRRDKKRSYLFALFLTILSDFCGQQKVDCRKGKGLSKLHGRGGRASRWGEVVLPGLCEALCP